MPANVRAGMKVPIEWWFAPELNYQAKYVKIEFSRDGGATWSLVAKKALNDGLQLWKVKSAPTANAKFRVCGLTAVPVCGESDAFTIQ
jgi:hypothetical protein